MVTAQGRRRLLIAHGKLCEKTAVEAKSKYRVTNRILRRSGGINLSSHVMCDKSANTPQWRTGQNKLGRKKRNAGVQRDQT